MRSPLNLYELNHLVHDVIDTDMGNSYWVQAELSQVSERGGHCYMELIQKEGVSITPIAKASAKCWRNSWIRIRPHFEQITGQRIHAGMKVLLLVHANFHENYGFSWIVDDIDATFTMGDMARKRMEIIDTLKREGVFELQKELSLPMFAQHIAVISSETAAGYGDFCNQLNDNDNKLVFHTELFSAIMQGEGVEQSIIVALNAINERSDDFDVVVIIRGGGATSDLSGFDTLMLAENVANFPLPIITGIGHDRDESVLDMVSFQRVKTPTAAAVFLINNLQDVYNCVMDAQDIIVDAVKRCLQMEKIKLDNIADRIPVLFGVVKMQQETRLERLMLNLTTEMQRRLHDEESKLKNLSIVIRPTLTTTLSALNHKIDMLEQRAKAVDPQLLLKRGYSITLKDGKAVKDSSILTSGMEIETHFAKGKVTSVVK